MKLRIKKCSAKELGEVAVAVAMSSQTAEAYVTRQNQQEGVFLGAWADGSPVGHVFLKWNPSLPEGYAHRVSGSLADLENLFVIAPYRSRGVGSAIIRAAERWARAQGCTLVGIAVDPERNPRAHALYVRHGFTDVGLLPFDASGQWTGSNGNVHSFEEWCIYMAKPL